jgi:hypothetical protein
LLEAGRLPERVRLRPKENEMLDFRVVELSVEDIVKLKSSDLEDHEIFEEMASRVGADVALALFEMHFL